MTESLPSDIREVTECEVCGGQSLTSVLNLGSHALCDDLVPIGDTRKCREYPIEVLYCETCRTGHQRFQVPKENLFPSSYHYRARFTKDVLTGMANVVESCEQRFGSLAGKLVLDVGCNDGSLLGFFRDKGAVTIGIEPTGAYRDAEEQGHITYNAFLSDDVADKIVAAHGSPDFITFTNVFAHIENLREVIGSLRRLMAPHTVIVIENHYLGSVLDTSQFDTFYHEHPRTYSYTSFVHIARSLGTTISDVEFPSRYGGNIRVYLGGRSALASGAARADEILAREGHFLERFGSLQRNVNRWRRNRGALIAEQVRLHGKVHAKAFPARAAILFKLLGLDEDSVAAVHEKPGSMKIGHYVPGTRVPIVSDDDLFAMTDKTKPVLNLAWHIPKEIRAYLVENGIKGPIIDIVTPDDFQSGERSPDDSR
jgi:hypothetical protein